MSLKQYLYVITLQVAELINEKKKSTQNEQKVQLTIAVIFKHVTDPTKKCTFYVKSENIEMRSGDNTDDITTKLLELFLENYGKEENILRNGSNYVFDCVDSALVFFHTVKLKRGSSYVRFPKWVSDKKATINLQNRKDNCCFVAYSVIATLHHQDISHNPERITKLKPYINSYN